MCDNLKFFYNVCLGLLLSVFLSGCTMTYVPRASTYDCDRIPTYVCGSRVELQNAQADPYEVYFFENMGVEYLADLYKWTDVAIAVAERELDKRGLQATSKDGNSLKLKVSKAYATRGSWGFRGHAVLEVTTGYGRTKIFRASAPSSHSMQNAASGALSSAVARMLSDSEIIYYLQR
jgi:hypothetical protein